MNCKTVLLKDLVLGEKGSYGIGAPAVDYDPKKYTYLRITDINDDGSINTNGLKSVDAEDAYKYVLQENDIVFARTGASTGKTYFYQPQDGTLVYAGFLIKFSIDPRKVNPRLLKYITHSQEYYNWVRSFDTGGTRGNINAVTFANMPITLPNRATQDKIVAILSSLDDKIELNRRINANLEQQAQALYKSWFVDFEPFGGKMPEDWREGTLGEICITNKRSYSGKFHNSFEYLDTGSVTSNKIDTIQLLNPTIDKIPSRARRAVTEGDILYSSVRPNQKHYMFLYNPSSNMVVSTGFIVITANWSGYRYYIYQYLIQDIVIQHLQSIAEQSVSTYPSINASDITNLEINIPSNKAIEKYANVMNPIMKQITNNQSENLRLAQLRDTLLPKLMSGEITV